MSRIFKILGFITGLGIVVCAALALGYSTGIFAGFPIGLDTFAHAYKASFIEQYFPDIFWSYHWAQGMPIFLWYAPFPYFLIVLAGKVTGSMLLSLTWLPVAATALAFVGVYLVTYELTKSSFLGIGVSLLGLANSSIWARLYMGEIPRVIAASFWPLAVWATIKVLKKKDIPIKENRLNWFFAWIFNALAFQSHFIFSAVTFLSLVTLIFFTAPKFKEKITLGVKILLPSLALASYVLIPFAITQSTSQIHGEDFFGKVKQFPISVNALFSYPFEDYFPEKFGQGEGHWGGGLTPILLPIAFLTIVLLTGKMLKRETKGSFILPLFLIALGSFIFGALSFIKSTLVYYNGALPPIDSYYFMSIAIPLFLGPALGKILSKTWLRILFSIPLIILTALVAYLQYPPNGEYAKIFPNQKLDKLVEQSKIPLIFKKDEKVTDYRLGTDEAEIAIWFNWIYDIPTTRDYYSQGILNQDWRFLYENAVFFWKDNPEQTSFLLDWFAVRWLRVAGPHYNGGKFRKQPELYEEITTIGKEGGLFKIKKPTPILSATNTPTVLLIGKDTDYIFRSLAFSDFGTDNVITVFGEESPDNYTQKELGKFDSIYLYQFKTDNFEKSAKLLSNYVNQGGNLLIEGVNSPIPDKLLDNLPDPWPAMRVSENTMSGNWQLEKDIFEEKVNVEEFSPPEGKWKTLQASKLKSWAYPVISLSGKPVAVAGNFGQGRVFFTGFNLPFHVTTFKNKEESFLLSQIFSLFAKPETPSPLYNIEFISPQKRKVGISGETKGILFKEAYFPNWSATATLENKKKVKLPIYRAGPDFMYVNLTNLPSTAKSVTFKYQFGLLKILSYTISIFSFIVICVFAIFPRALGPLFGFIQSKLMIVNRLKYWWDKEGY